MWQDRYLRERNLRDRENSCVWLMRDRQTEEKVIFRQFRGDGAVYRALLKADCPNLPHVLDVQEQDGWVLVLEEYIQGDCLEDLLKGCLMTPQEAVQIAGQLCRALEVLHGLGAVHRDIKPSNIILRGSQAVLIDFDAARIHKQAQSNDTQVMGTTGYAAPEQYGFGQIDARTDLYAMGVLLNVMVTGRHPSQTLVEGSLRPVVERCIAVNVDRRYPSAQALAQALRPGKKRRLPWMAAAVVLCCLVGGALWWAQRPAPEQTPQLSEPAQPEQIEEPARPEPAETPAPAEPGLYRDAALNEKVVGEMWSESGPYGYTVYFTPGEPLTLYYFVNASAVSGCYGADGLTATMQDWEGGKRITITPEREYTWSWQGAFGYWQSDGFVEYPVAFKPSGLDANTSMKNQPLPGAMQFDLTLDGQVVDEERVTQIAFSDPALGQILSVRKLMEQTGEVNSFYLGYGQWLWELNSARSHVEGTLTATIDGQDYDMKVSTGEPVAGFYTSDDWSDAAYLPVHGAEPLACTPGRELTVWFRMHTGEAVREAYALDGCFLAEIFPEQPGTVRFTLQPDRMQPHECRLWAITETGQRYKLDVCLAGQ